MEKTWKTWGGRKTMLQLPIEEKRVKHVKKGNKSAFKQRK